MAFGQVFDKLAEYLDYWFWFCDFDKNGLCVWDGSDHSGMDNQVARLGYDGRMTIEGVDLNCYLARDLLAMGEIAGELGRSEDHERFLAHAARLSALIDRTFWDEAAGFYFDRDERTSESVKIRSIAGLIPLWPGIAPPERAKRLIEEHLLNTDEFWLKYPPGPKMNPATTRKDEAGNATGWGRPGYRPIT